MEYILQVTRDLKTKAKNRRDREDYSGGVSILKEKTIPPLENEINNSTSLDLKKQLAIELSDCYGLLGGIFRRWALQSIDEEDKKKRLKDSVDAYENGYGKEKDYEIKSTYNRLNRLISYILLNPSSLNSEEPIHQTEGDFYNVKEELKKTKEEIVLQSEERGRDTWALADLGLVSLLLEESDALSRYIEFNLLNPPDYAYESALATLRPLSSIGLPVTKSIDDAINLLQARFNELYK